jgi:hypothetical protein
MQGIYNYILETAEHVSTVYGVAVILYLQFIIHIMLHFYFFTYFYISASQSMHTVPNTVVFSSSLMSCFLGISLFSKLLRDGSSHPLLLVSLLFTFHMCCTSIIRYLHF